MSRAERDRLPTGSPKGERGGVHQRRIGDDGVEAGFLRRVQLAQRVPLVGQGVAVEDLELRVLHPVQQHVHAGQVVGGVVLFLAVDLHNAPCSTSPVRLRTLSRRRRFYQLSFPSMICQTLRYTAPDAPTDELQSCSDMAAKR